MNDVMDENEVAALLACEPSTVEEAARKGELPAVKFGRSWRFPRSALLAVLHEKAMANKPKAAKPKAVVSSLPRRQPPALPQALG